MHPAASLRTPVSSIVGSCNAIRKLCASPRAIGRTNLAFSNGSIAGPKTPALCLSAARPHGELKDSGRSNCVNKASCAERQTDGIHALRTTLDNLAKLWRNPPFNGIDGSDIETLTADQIPTSPLYSPKQSLGERWEDYQGRNNWEGLLDPLDANLRREIVKYGDFVRAAYNAFDFDPQSKSYASCKYTKQSVLDMAGLKNSGYKVTRNIYATSTIQLPKWLTSLASYNQRGTGFDAQWMNKRSSWVGFVAVCDDEREIARLGRRDIVVAYRGTATPFEWAENLKHVLTPAWHDSEAKVESGFWSLYTCSGPTGHSAADQVLNEVRRLAELYKDEKVSITITGHSLGAALSLLTAYQLGAELSNSSTKSNRRNRIPVTVFSFGGPRVGNRAFGRRLEEKGSRVLRIVNAHDMITRVPGVLLNEWVQRPSDDKLKKVARFLMPWAYCHVGAELRVNSRDSPYLKPDADMACCHDLEAYLHLVDGFLSSTTPFRPSAKRDIAGLLIAQKSNVLLKPATFRRIIERYRTSHLRNNKRNSHCEENTPSPKCAGS